MPRKPPTRARARARDREFEKAATSARLAAVAALLTRCVARADVHRIIAKEHGVTALQVKQDVSAVFKQWRAQTMSDVGTYRAQQMIRCEKTILEAWQAWSVPVKQWDPLMDNGPGKKPGGWYYDKRPEPRFLEHILKATMFEASLTGTRRPVQIQVVPEDEIARAAAKYGIDVQEAKALYKEFVAPKQLSAGPASDEEKEPA